MSENGSALRLQVFLARAGIASRRKSEAFIVDGRVTVNGKKVTELGTKVNPGDQVAVDGRTIHQEENRVYIALNKPVRFLCSQSDPENRPLAVDLLRPEINERVFHVGRLDFMSSGLVFFTNDGNFAERVSHPSYPIEKEYILDSAVKIPHRFLESFLQGITIEGETYRLKRYHLISPTRISLTLVEGKNREIRRVFEHADIHIDGLTRIRIGIVSLEGIHTAGFRRLTQEEVNWFFARRKHGSGN